jgi:hypothetical protein
MLPLFNSQGDAMIQHHVKALSIVPGMREILLIGIKHWNYLMR